MTEAAPPPPPPVLPPQPPALARVIALDLVTRFHLRLTDPRDSRLGALRDQYELGAAGWTGTVATFVGFYTPSSDPHVAGHDLAARCAAAAQWGAERLATQGAERADILIVALGPMQGSIAAPTLNPAVNVGAVAIDPATADVVGILPTPRALPNAGDLRTRARMLQQGAEPPTLAAVDLAERQSVAGGYAAPARQQMSTRPVAAWALIATFVVIWIAEKALSASQQDPLYNMGELFWGPGALPDWWRLFSYAFLHLVSGNSFGLGDLPVHLLFNSIAMFIIGGLVERIYGRLVLVAGFVACAAGGAVLWVGFHIVTNSIAASVGASGGLMGLLGMVFMVGRVQGKDVPAGVLHSLHDYAMRYAVSVLVLGYLIGADTVGHVCGFLVGLAVGAVIPPLRRVGGRDLSRWEHGGMLGVIAIAGIALLFAVVNVATNSIS